MITNKNAKIIVIIPAFNEEGKIGVVVYRIKKESRIPVDKILVVDDGSKDKTRQEAEAGGALVISTENNCGVGNAIRTGIDYALKNNYAVAVVMGGDNQDNPAEMHRLLSPILYDHFDFVQGSRYAPGGERVNIPLFRLVTTSLYPFFLRMALRFPVSDGTNGFRAFRLSIFKNKYINIWQDWLNRYELEPYLFYKVIEHNFKVTEAPVTKSYPKEKIGYTKMVPVLSWWSILRPVILLKLRLRK